MSATPPEKHYLRLGGAGIVKTLYECRECGCAVSNKKLHNGVKCS